MIEDDYALLPAGAHEPEPKRCCELQDPKLFLAKNLFIWVATFAFIPLIAADQAGRISSLICLRSAPSMHLYARLGTYPMHDRQLSTASIRQLTPGRQRSSHIEVSTSCTAMA